MSKSKSLILVWVLMVSAVIVQVVLAKYVVIVIEKTVAVIAISFLLTFLSGFYFIDLRNETKYLTLVPISGFLVVLSLIIGAIAGGG